MMIEKKIGFMIHGSTGCSCCSNDNFISGIYHSDYDAAESAEYHYKSKTVCSQYSTNGIYTVREIEYERLEDDRIIIKDRVFDDGSFFENGDIANELKYYGKEIIRFE